MPLASSQRSTPSTLTTMDSTTITARLVAISSRTRFMGSFLGLFRGSVGAGLYGFQDGACAFLGDDIRRCICISGSDARKHRRIDHAQPLHTVHAELFIHHLHWIAPHLAGS